MIMGFFSNLCAVSGQSIPADCVEPCDVTVFLPDGTTRSGVYDGYGNVDGFDVRDFLRTYYKDMQHGDIFDFVEERIKIVKTAYVTPAMTYDNLPASKNCPAQGFFFGRGKPWNKPAYKPGK